MSKRGKLTKLLISKHYKDKPLLEKKVAVLRAQLSLVMAIVGIFYVVIDSSFGHTYNLHIYFGLFLVSTITLVLNRKGYAQLSNFLILITVNTVVYLFAASDVNHKVASGVFFIPIAFGALALYGYKKRYVGFAFALLSVVLFYLSVYGNVSFLRNPDGSFPDYIFKRFYLINVMACMVVGTLNVYFFLRINHYSEKKLGESKKKIEDAYSKLDKLFYIVSHDVKAPLNSIKGLIHISKRSDDVKELKTYLQMMEERAIALEKFIMEIGDYSRNAHTETTLKSLNLYKTVKEIIDLIRFSDKSSEINFIVDIPEALEIKSDLLRLKIIFSNLISNAIQYHDPTKKNRYIKITATSTDTHCNITVEDNGVGIAKEHVVNIFKMFYRVSEQISGSGLGLYIVHDAVAALQGTISVESTPKEGTHFHIKLPLQPSPLQISALKTQPQLENMTH